MNIEVILAILLAVLIFLVLVVLYKLFRPTADDSKDRTLEELKGQEQKIEETRKELQQLLTQQNELLNNRLSESNKTLLDQLDKSQRSSQQNFAISQKAINQTQEETAKIIKDVTQKLTVLEKTNEQVVDFAKQMESLEKILKNPKQRGVLGEYFLETTLKNVLPPDSYQMQYKFGNGEIVDAVVFVKDKIVPVDSKFSLENYNRIIEESDQTAREALEKTFRADLKKRIDETSKYIRPEEGTMEFAFMFIPSEGIYTDLLNNQVGVIKTDTESLVTYAFKKNVIITSPTTFLAFLQTVLQGLRMLQIEESAQLIKKNVTKLAKHLKAYDEYFGKVGKHLSTTVNAYNSAGKELKKVDKDIYAITDERLEIGNEGVEKPDDI